ncbi:MAG: DUF1254 domain-containing protein [Acetobacteraceae bacterium]|nr:DUF1254 domain-containing protein [Acetobacteraceae bacterium]
MSPLATRLRHMRLRLPLAALVLSALALGGAPRGHAQTSASPGSATAAPAPTCSSGTGQSSLQSAQDILDNLGQQDPVSAGAYATTAAYVAQFYPLWFTYYQSLGGSNQLIGPDRVSPIYNVVVLINVDTVYASAFLDLTAEPVIVTVPSTPVNYSIQVLDSYGDIYSSDTTGFQPNIPGVYALIGPGGFSGTLPTSVTQTVTLPLNAMVLTFRADRHTPISAGPPYNDVTDQANAFRTQLKLQTLSGYLSNPDGGAAQVLPEVYFAFPLKLTADELVARDPILFLRTLQFAVRSSRTPPMTPFEQALSSRFDALFGNGVAQRPEFAAGAQLAHALIVNCYTTHTGPTNWVHFDNIGDWNGGTQVIDRSAITEFCQYCNTIATAAYYHAFEDAAGRQLDGRNPRGYVLTFPKQQIPQAMRFWSLTAYTPDTVELIPNPAQKYVVGSYTPGLQYNDSDGSLSLYISTVQPPGVPSANWLPAFPGPFNVALRIYGPTGDVSENYDAGAYLPPGIQSR